MWCCVVTAVCVKIKDMADRPASCPSRKYGEIHGRRERRGGGGGW